VQPVGASIELTGSAELAAQVSAQLVRVVVQLAGGHVLFNLCQKLFPVACQVWDLTAAADVDKLVKHS